MRRASIFAMLAVTDAAASIHVVDLAQYLDESCQQTSPTQREPALSVGADVTACGFLANNESMETDYEQ